MELTGSTTRSVGGIFTDGRNGERRLQRRGMREGDTHSRKGKGMVTYIAGRGKVLVTYRYNKGSRR